MALQMGQNNALFQNRFSCWHQIIRAPYCFTIYLAMCSQCCRRDEPCLRPSSTINPHQWPPAHSNKLSLADKHSTTPEFTADSGSEEGWWDRNGGGIASWMCKWSRRLKSLKRWLTNAPRLKMQTRFSGLKARALPHRLQGNIYCSSHLLEFLQNHESPWHTQTLIHSHKRTHFTGFALNSFTD